MLYFDFCAGQYLILQLNVEGLSLGSLRSGGLDDTRWRRTHGKATVQ